MNGYEAEIMPTKVSVYTKDAIGSVRGVVYGSSIESYDYTAFGESLDGVEKEGVSYTGHYFDKESEVLQPKYREVYSAG